MQPIQYVAGPMPAWKAHVALLAIAVLPLFVYVQPNLNVILTAALAVFVGSWRSVKTQVATEAMTKKDAMRFPIVGSCVLFGLFLTFKFLPKDIVNMLLGLYFVGLGMFAITASMLPFLEHLCPESLRDFKSPPIMIPYLLEEPIELDAPSAAGAAISLVVCCWYFFKKNWFANNVMGLAFSITGIEHLSLGSMHVGCILLSGLFFYDIFWVFCTPVMVSVAKSFDAPIKLLFPRGMAVPGEKRQMGMLGLGDIVIPGIFVALVLRYDYRHAFKSKYFQTAFWGYTAGLGATIVVMNYFQAAQPALLYIVPAVLGSVFLHAALKGEFKKVFEYSEQDHAAAADAGKDKESKQE